MVGNKVACIWCGMAVEEHDGMELKHFINQWKLPGYNTLMAIKATSLIHIDCLDRMASHLLRMKLGQVVTEEH